MNEQLVPWKEAILEFFRIAVIAAIPVIILQLEAGRFEWRPLVVSLLIALGKALDRGKHVEYKNEEIDKKGLLPF